MEMIKHTHNLDVCRPVLKFFIGFVAGLCAVIAPRMLAALTVPVKDEKIIFFSFDYVVVSLAFSIMIGAVIMIIEWRQPKKPGRRPASGRRSAGGRSTRGSRGNVPSSEPATALALFFRPTWLAGETRGNRGRSRPA